MMHVFSISMKTSLLLLFSSSQCGKIEHNCGLTIESEGASDLYHVG